MVSYPVFEFRKFANPILSELEESTDKNCSEIFDRHFERLVENYDLELILRQYCNLREIKSAKCRYCCDYVEKKVNILLFEKILKTIERQQRKKFR